MIKEFQGNLTKEEHPEGITFYNYNSFNQTIKAETKEGNTLVSRYDGEGLRYEIEENEKLTRFIFHKDNILLELDNSDDILVRYSRGYEIVSSQIEETRYYYHQEEQGSTAYITNEDEKVENSYFYDAFGAILESSENIPNRITYTGQQYDGITQQYYLRARNYNPVIGRFTQEDIYRGDGLDLYSYCHNNPVVYYDPSGFIPCTPSKEQPSAGGGGQLKATPDGMAEPEVYYRTMKEKHYKRLQKNNKIPATGETCISPTEAYAKGYDGVLVKFEVEPGTKALLEKIGVKNDSPITNLTYPDMKYAEEVSNWNKKYALFKGEGLKGKKGVGEAQINIGLGKGDALDIFNNNIINFERIDK